MIEDLANITCRQFLEEKHVHLSVEKSIQNFEVEDKNYKVNMSLYETNDYTSPFKGKYISSYSNFFDSDNRITKHFSR